MRAKSIAMAITALCLMWAFGAAGAAFADEPTTAQSTVVGEIAGGAEEGAESEPEIEHADGWEKTDSSWTYWKDNVQVRGQFVITGTGPGIAGAKSGNQKYWIAQDGALAMSRLIDPESSNDQGAGSYYYATKYGYVAKGKTVVGDQMYLANSSSGKLAKGNSKGFLSTKKFDNGKRRRYYINPKTHAVTMGKPVKAKGFGWTFSYPGKKKGYLLTGVKKVDKTHVVLATKNGKLRNKAGWVTTKTYTGKSKQRYYLQRTKKYKSLYGARIGLFKVKGKRYFGQSKGYVVRNGYKLIKKKYYHADKKGALTYSGVITNMYRNAQSYTSPSKYLIMVDVNDTKVMVLTGSKGKWKTKYIWECVTGAPSTPTPIGVWHVGTKGYSFGSGFTCYYYTQITGNYLFHSQIYYQGTHTLSDASMNVKASHGCVRLHYDNAYWVYKNIPSGTTVVTIP